MNEQIISLEDLNKDILSGKYSLQDLNAIGQCLEVAKQHQPCVIRITHYSKHSKSFSIIPLVDAKAAQTAETHIS